MRKITGFLSLTKLFFRLVAAMLHNYRYLNDDLENNFMVCKKICQNIVKSAKIDLTIQGQEHIPKDKPFLLVPNHRCFFDVVFLLADLEVPVSFVAAKELWNYPVLRKYLSSILCIPMDRYTRNLTRLKQNISQIQESLSLHNLVMFPEGECSYEREEMHRFKKGGFMGVTGMDVYIVPAFIKIGAFRHIGRKWMIPSGEVSLVVGEPFEPSIVSEGRVKATDLAEYAQCRVRELSEREN